MKKILYSIAALALAGGVLTSCDDFLDEPVHGQQNLDSYFTSEDEATTYLNGCYNALTYYGWWQIQNFWIMTDMCSDDMWMGNLSQDQGDYMSLAHYQGIGENGSAGIQKPGKLCTVAPFRGALLKRARNDMGPV